MREKDVTISTVCALDHACWGELHRLQQACYVAYLHEDCLVLKSKWQASPQTCFQCRDATGQMFGYLLSHPWSLSTPPSLNRGEVLSEQADQLFLHDLAVSPKARGQGVAKQLLTRLFQCASSLGYRRILLVAVQDSVPFWRHYGFQLSANPMPHGYGEGACLLTLTLA